MTSKDRVLSALTRNKGDRLPFFTKDIPPHNVVALYEEAAEYSAS